MIKYVDGIDVLEELAKCGFTQYRLRHDKVFGVRTIQKLKAGGLPSMNELSIICAITGMNVGDILTFKRSPDDNY